MKMTKLWRTFKEGAKHYKRNGWLTVATVSVLTMSLFVISLAGFIGFAGYLGLKSLEEKVSISVSFKPETGESRILSIKSDLEKYREISSIRYISRDQALDDFLREGNPAFVEAVKEIGENPLYASLVIKATDPVYYDLISAQLQNSSYKDDIAKVNYERNKKKIQSLTELTNRIRNIGFLLGGIFIVIAVMITFNTIRLTIYSNRQEFEVMRLVGASNLYIKAPFFFEGIFYGISAAILTLIFLSFSLYGLSQNIGAPFAEIMNGKTFFGVYVSFLWFIAPLILIASILLGVISGSIAIRRYLKV